MKKLIKEFFTEPWWTPFGMVGYISWMVSFDDRTPPILRIIFQIIAFLALLNSMIKPFTRKK